MRQLRLLEVEPQGHPGLRLTSELRTALVQMMAVAIQSVYRGRGGRDESGQSASEDHAAAPRP